jgi:hypothetical protein
MLQLSNQKMTERGLSLQTQHKWSQAGQHNNLKDIMLSTFKTLPPPQSGTGSIHAAYYLKARYPVIKRDTATGKLRH